MTRDANHLSRAARGEPGAERSARGGRSAIFRPRSTAAERGAEDTVPIGRADPEAALVVLEVMAHVQLAQPAAEPRARAAMVEVVVRHVVDQVSGKEACAEGEG